MSRRDARNTPPLVTAISDPCIARCGGTLATMSPSSPDDAPDPTAARPAGDAGAPDASSQQPRPGWAPFLQVGRRVVLRHLIDRERSAHGESMTDALGTISAVDERRIHVMTRRGEVAVQRVLVIAAKEVPPPPQRRIAAPPDGDA